MVMDIADVQVAKDKDKNLILSRESIILTTLQPSKHLNTTV